MFSFKRILWGLSETINLTNASTVVRMLIMRCRFNERDYQQQVLHNPTELAYMGFATSAGDQPL